MIVMKFGGTSVGSSWSIKNVNSIVKSRLAKKPLVVVSAVGGVTDMLIKAGNAAAAGEDFEGILKEIKEKHEVILKELGVPHNLTAKEFIALGEHLKVIAKSGEMTKKLYDTLVSFGERISAKQIASYLSHSGIKSEAFNAYDIGMVTNDEHGSAEVLPEAYDKIAESLKAKKNIVPVVTGFIGKTKSGDITTLGRGGSDYTAAIIGAAIGAEEIQIWTDVDGIKTADPKVVAQARTIDTISFGEASELAYFGAKVLHPKTILPAMKKNIPVRVLNTHNPDNPGTVILEVSPTTGKILTAIASKKGITLVNIKSTRMLEAYGYLAKIFEVFGKYKTPIDVVGTSEVGVSISIDNTAHLEAIVKELEAVANVSVMPERAIVCVVGKKISETAGVLGKIFSVTGKHNINVELVTQCAISDNVSFVVKDEDAHACVKALHDELVG